MQHDVSRETGIGNLCSASFNNKYKVLLARYVYPFATLFSLPYIHHQGNAPHTMSKKKTRIIGC